MSLTAPIGRSEASNRHGQRKWIVAWRHRKVELHHVSWRKSTCQQRSPTFDDIDSRRLMPIRRARLASDRELSVNGHGHVTPRKPHPKHAQHDSGSKVSRLPRRSPASARPRTLPPE